MLVRCSSPVLALLLLLGLAPTPAAHGGHYRPPPEPEAPPPKSGGSATGGNRGPAMPMSPASGPAGPGSPGGLAPGIGGGGLATTGGAGSELDLTSWRFWWDQNKAAYLDLKTHVHRPGPLTGSDGFFLGEGAREAEGSLRPSERQVREQVVPALLAVLETETNQDLVTGALVALAKIGHGGDLDESGRFEAAVARLLRDPNQELRETAAVAQGIVASSHAIPRLANLLWDTDAGRELVGATEVDPRTRAFAAYGLGLVGARSTSEPERQVIVAALGRALERARLAVPDVEVACVQALSLVPLDTLEPAGARADAARSGEPPERSRQAQVEFVAALLADPERHLLVRAHCPAALARLLIGLPHEEAELRARAVRVLQKAIESERTLPVLVQSACLALGELGASGDGLDDGLRVALEGTVRRSSDVQSRAFALIALARGGGGVATRDAVAGFLLRTLLEGKGTLRPWAGLACGVLGRELMATDPGAAPLAELRATVRAVLEEERNPERLGAYAIAAGLLRDRASAPLLQARLAKSLPDDVRGHVATGLALLGHVEACDLVRTVLSAATYRPELTRECGIALALLDDKEVTPMLVGMLQRAPSLATQTTLATALGLVGDRRAIDPLLAALRETGRTERARGYAAVALGNVADKEALPWNAKYALGINYRAATATLTDPVYGGGILDIF